MKSRLDQRRDGRDTATATTTMARLEAGYLGSYGLGFFIRGEGMIPTYFGHLSSPETFGAFGAGSTNMWVDPTRDMIMVCLTTGILEETNSAARFQRLSDIAIAEYYC